MRLFSPRYAGLRAVNPTTKTAAFPLREQRAQISEQKKRNNKKTNYLGVRPDVELRKLGERTAENGQELPMLHTYI